MDESITGEGGGKAPGGFWGSRGVAGRVPGGGVLGRRLGSEGVGRSRVMGGGGARDGDRVVGGGQRDVKVGRRDLVDRSEEIWSARFASYAKCCTVLTAANIIPAMVATVCVGLHLSLAPVEEKAFAAYLYAAIGSLILMVAIGAAWVGYTTRPLEQSSHRDYFQLMDMLY